jgi:phosphoribosylamine-glycine ligase
MLPSQDYKRAYNQDKGPNTGGMGAFCPCYNMPQNELDEAKNILQRAVDGLRNRGSPFVGEYFLLIIVIFKMYYLFYIF